MSTRHNKLIKFGRILFVSMCVFFIPIFASAQGLSFKTGIEIISDYDSVKSDRLTTLSTSSFRGYWRYPAEERQWMQMINATAYFRDVLAGAITYISGATDGETWNIEILYPEGTSQTLSPLIFYQSYDGYSDCFVYEGTILYCGSTNVTVLWRVRVQCFPPGLWTMNFYNNNNYLFSTQFTLLPQIYPNKVPLYNQGSYTDAYDTICYIIQNGKRVLAPCSTQGAIPYTIKQKGCYLTDAAMMLSYHGVSVDPPTLNTWLINYKDKNGKPAGYNKNGDVYRSALVKYASDRGVNMTYNPVKPDPQKVWSGLEELEKYICYYGPHMIGVKNDEHWVTATGRDADRTTYKINDPNGGVATTLAQVYNNTFSGIRKFGGPEYTYTDRTGIEIRFHSPGELLLTDPQGRRVGYDPRTGTKYNEIPEAFYEPIGLEDAETGEPGPYTKELEIPRPLAGDYQLDVIGTDTGTYTLEINATDPELNPSIEEVENISITPNEVHIYGFYYAKTVGAELEFKAIPGNFDGKGQRPSDVNKFLSYVTPTQSATTLPAGTTSFSLVVIYDKNIIPATLTATLNGVDVSPLFHPVSGGMESVTLNLNQGRNTLILSVEGNLPNRVARDTDRLVFIVP